MDGPKVDSEESDPVRDARRSLLKVVWEASGFSDTIATKFSSKPLDMDGYFTGSNPRGSFSETPMSHADSNTIYRQSIFSASYLTADEKLFLEELLQSEDHESIQYASKRLSDRQLFPLIDDEDQNLPSSEARNGRSQSSSSDGHKVPSPPVGEGVSSATQSLSHRTDRTTYSDRHFAADFKTWTEELFQEEENSTSIPTPTSGPFMILGLSSDATLTRPRVVSPPLVESLLAFVPESLQSNCNFWLKYSMTRDGASLLTLLRQCRASVNTILAIESKEGFVFGSFTSQPWQLSSDGFFGSDESFVWRMRHSRADRTTISVLESISRESKIDVYPCTSKNDKIQFCCKEFLALGEGELEGMKVDGKYHFGNAIRLDDTMTRGSTSTSNTFDNPSLLHTDKRGEEFIVKNAEVWALTPHSSSIAAIRAEMRSLFLEEEARKKKLNLLEILVS